MVHPVLELAVALAVAVACYLSRLAGGAYRDEFMFGTTRQGSTTTSNTTTGSLVLPVPVLEPPSKMIMMKMMTLAANATRRCVDDGRDNGRIVPTVPSL